MSHPTADCHKFMRRTLLEDLDELYDEAPKERDWRQATRDAGMPFPTAEEIRQEDWATWHEAVVDQILNASNRQVDVYFHDRHQGCACGADWS